MYAVKSRDDTSRCVNVIVYYLRIGLHSNITYWCKSCINRFLCDRFLLIDSIMYADDTTLASTLENFGTVNDVTNLEREWNQEITKVYSWLLSNKIMLNAAKSKFMIFFFKDPKVVPRLSLTIARNPIEQVNEFNFLGITLDQNITWKPYKDC